MKCPCCNQEIPERHGIRLLPVGNVVMVNGASARLTPAEFKIMQALRNRQMPMRELVDKVYGDDENGGPDFPENTIAVLQAKLNKKLKLLGIRAGSDRRGSAGALQGIWPCE